MKLKMFLAAVLALGFLFGGTAFGQESVKAKFYIFPTMNIDGDYKAPAVTFTNPREKVRFERLLKLKRSFFKELQETGKDTILK